MPQSNPVESFSVEDRRIWWRERWFPAIYTGVALSAVAAMLGVNVLDVRLGWVRLLYGAVAGWLVVFFFARSFRIWQFQQANVGRATDSSGRNGILRGLELALFAILWLLALEASARALPPLSNSSLNYPGHAFVWPERFVGQNSLGLSDAEPGLKGRGPRILVLGDSYVEGAGVRRADRFCSRLQLLLQQTQPSCQVIAGGVCGWNTHDEADLLERSGQQLAPDVVVVGYVLNDVEREDRLSERPTPWELWLQTRLRSYLCYRMFRWRRSGFDEYWSQVRTQHASNSESWRAVEKSLARIEEWCRREKIPCHLVVLPIFTSDADAVRDVLDQVVERATRLGFTAYSTLDDFDGEWSKFAVSPHDAHPDASGHERIARRIARELEKDGAFGEHQ